MFDTPAGHALFKLKKPEKLQSPDDLYKSFTDPEAAGKLCAPPAHLPRTLRAVNSPVRVLTR